MNRFFLKTIFVVLIIGSCQDAEPNLIFENSSKSNPMEIEYSLNGTIKDTIKIPVFSDKINNPSTNLKQINNGDNLVLWYSVELYKELVLPAYKSSYTPPSSPTTIAPSKSIEYDVPAERFTANLNGTVFIHGMFFAHEQESTEGDIGSTTEEYIPSGSPAPARLHRVVELLILIICLY